MRDRLTLPPSSLSLLTPCPVLAASVPLLDEETDATQREPSHSPLKPTKPLPAPPPPPIPNWCCFMSVFYHVLFGAKSILTPVLEFPLPSLPAHLSIHCLYAPCLESSMIVHCLQIKTKLLTVMRYSSHCALPNPSILSFF